MSESHSSYYLPDPNYWSITGSIGLFTIFVGAAIWFNGFGPGSCIFLVGFAVFVYMLFGWFGTVIHESDSGKFNE